MPLRIARRDPASAASSCLCAENQDFGGCKPASVHRKIRAKLQWIYASHLEAGGSQSLSTGLIMRNDVHQLAPAEEGQVGSLARGTRPPNRLKVILLGGPQCRVQTRPTRRTHHCLHPQVWLVVVHDVPRSKRAVPR